jgi:dimethylamine/trimethylamine dehydrogenase
MDPRHEILFRPITVGPKTLRNRFYHTPQCSGFGSDRPAANAYHRAMKAAGGFAVVHTAWSGIHPEADQWPGHSGRIWDATDVRNAALLVERIHDQGAHAGMQLGFNGVHAENLETRICARGVNQVTSDSYPFHSCYTMTRGEIRELQGFYVAAARRAREAGFDFIQIMASAACGIPLLFLMQAHNRRTDE